MARPETENWLLDRFTWLMLAEIFPVFATERVWETFLPTTVLPKLMLPGVTWIAACGGDEDCGPFAPTTPAQPVRTSAVASAKTAGTARHCHNCRTLRNASPRTCLRNFPLRKVIEVTALQLLRKESGVSVRTKILLTLIASSALMSASRLGAGVGPLKLKQMLCGSNFS